MQAITPEEKTQIQQRLDALERQMAGILHAPVPSKDWRSTIGMWKDDDLAREADRLGREWRQSVTD